MVIAAVVLVVVALVAALVLEAWIDADNDQTRVRLDRLQQK
jgi:hypothetical protein